MNSYLATTASNTKQWILKEMGDKHNTKETYCGESSRDITLFKFLGDLIIQSRQSG